MVNWVGRGKRGVGERVDDEEGVGGPEDSIEDIVGGPLLEVRASGVVWRKEHCCP
jgi:hypothetical protein